jgi:hypothetical protein
VSLLLGHGETFQLSRITHPTMLCVLRKGEIVLEIH